MASLSANDINILHIRKQAKSGVIYESTDGNKYIGNPNGSLKLLEDASDILFTSTSTISANNVQDAIEEVDSSSIKSVTGLNTDNANPQNPIVKISVDGTTISGSGTPLDPLVATTPGSYIESVSNTDTVSLDVTSNNLTANVNYQDTQTVAITEDSGGLKADVVYQNTSDINLSEDVSGLKAEFASHNISQFTNDSGYLTSAVTSVSATSPITSSGGNTPTISTSINTNKLIGRNTAGVGVMEEISIGNNLSLSSGVLSANGLPSGIASGTDIYAVSISGVASYSDGDCYLIRFTNGNTTDCTLNINSLGAISLYRNNDGALLGGDIQDGAEMICVYNLSLNTFQCIGISPNSLFAYVTNADSVTITKGMPVYAFGGTGDRMTVKRAYNTSDATSAQTVGLVMSSSIASNQKGLIIIQGLLDGLSILPTSTYSDGDALYLGATAGTITKIKPYAPNHLVYLGVVTTASNGSAGRMYVRVQNGYELDELHNVQAQSPTLKDTLWYDNTVSPAQWKTASISTILGYTAENVANKENTTLDTSSTKYPTNNLVKTNIDLKAPIASPTFTGTVTTPAIVVSSETASRIAILDASKNIKSADTATYPSLTELAYVKGVTSAVQTQLNSKKNRLLKIYEALGSNVVATTLNVDPTTAITTFTLINQSARFQVFYLEQDCTIASVMFYMAQQGSYTANNNNFIGIHTISGGTLTMVAQTANNGNLWKGTANSWVTENLSTPYVATAGVYFLSFIYNNSAEVTVPQITASTNLGTARATLMSMDFPNSIKLCGVITGQTTIPTPISMTSLTANQSCPLFMIVKQ